ncbi:RING-3 [Rhexocercosporidium sp. MPI-PUGE-AT-0058]|nr:RING-3 [Rhexocercosporidium sp. MPI-PUGE-AT-0058]
MPSEQIAGSKKAQKIRQACDCCHARKIRCDGTAPCKNCQITELHCTYLAVPKKKGPKGRRIAKEVKPIPIQRPRIFEQSNPPAPDPAGLQHPIHTPVNSANAEPHDFSLFNILIPTPNVLSPENGPSIASSSSADSNASGFRASPLLSAELVKTCLDAFFTHKYPIMPILDLDITYAIIPHLHEMPEQYGLIAALCALILFQPEIIDAPELGSPWPSPQDMINEAVRARGFCDHIEKPTLATIHTSFFLYASMFCLGKDNSAWFYIRESMTCLQLLRLHEEITYHDLDADYSKYCRRTFWLLFITEKAYALQRHRPVTLQVTIDLPTVDPGPEATILSGFLDLVSLFQHFDESFMTLWNTTEIQQADLRVSRQWLRTLVWQLCVSKGFLSSQSSDESMSFQYPISIARDVVQVARSLPVKAFEANGVGILEKVFDIGCSLSDVLLLNPDAVNKSSLEIGPKDYLLEMVRLLGTTPGGDKYLRMLTLKADGFLKLHLRGSLSESEASDRFEEIFDDDENVIAEQSAVHYPVYGGTLVDGNFKVDSQVDTEPYETPEQDPSMMMGDPCLAFSMPTPGWEAFWPPNAPEVD